MQCTFCSNEVELSDTEVAGDSTCACCEMVLSHVCKVDRQFRPNDASIAIVRATLEGVDKSDGAAVWDALIGAGPSIANVPALQPSKKPRKLSRSKLSKWKKHYSEFLSNTDNISIEKLPLPGGKKMSVHTHGDIFGERNHSWCQEPLADLAEYFINSDGSSTEFSNWFELTQLLKVTTQCFSNNEISIHSWFQNGFTECLPPTFESSDVELMFNFDPPYLRVGRTHPFICYATTLVDTNLSSLFCQKNSEHLPKMWPKAERQLGSIATSWREILESDSMNHARKSIQGPSLVVFQQRLHLVVRGKDGYSLKSLPQNMDVWRHLIGWSLYHPSTEQNNYLRAIQWIIDCDDATAYIGPKPEFRALSLLSQTCESLGESVSQSKNDGFIVEGTSSLWYSVRPTRTATDSAIEVHAFRNKKSAQSWKKPIKICIQLIEHGFHEYPLADMLAAYLLTLRNDQGSADNVATLLNLHQTWFENTKGKSAKDWSEMAKIHPYGFHVDDDYDDWDEEWEDEMFDVDDETEPQYGIELEEQNRLLFEWLESSDNDPAWIVSLDEGLEKEQGEEGQVTNEEDVWKYEADARGETHCIRSQT